MRPKRPLLSLGLPAEQEFRAWSIFRSSTADEPSGGNTKCDMRLSNMGEHKKPWGLSLVSTCRDIVVLQLAKGLGVSGK